MTALTQIFFIDKRYICYCNTNEYCSYISHDFIKNIMYFKNLVLWHIFFSENWDNLWETCFGDKLLSFSSGRKVMEM